MRFLNSNRLAVAAAVLVVGSLSLTACRHRRSFDEKRAYKHATMHVDDLLDDLDADAAQSEAIHASKDRLFQAVMKARPDAIAARLETLTEWKKAEPDAERVHALVDEQVDRLRALMHLGADEILATHRVLNQEQRDEITERIEDHLNNR